MSPSAPPYSPHSHPSSASRRGCRHSGQQQQQQQQQHRRAGTARAFRRAHQPTCRPWPHCTCRRSLKGRTTRCIAEARASNVVRVASRAFARTRSARRRANRCRMGRARGGSSSLRRLQLMRRLRRANGAGDGGWAAAAATTLAGQMGTERPLMLLPLPPQPVSEPKATHVRARAVQLPLQEAERQEGVFWGRKVTEIERGRERE